MKEILKQSFLTALTTLTESISNVENIAKTAQAAELLAATFNAGNKALSAGNGGSLCDAMHFAEEFTGRFRSNRRALPALALSDSSHITCVGNDFGFDEIFARGVQAFGQKGDVFVGLSTSGNSANIIKAVEAAKEQGLKTILLLGKDGGQLKGMADIEFIIPGETSDRIQEVHMTILHIMIEGTERILFPENY
ncbi:MAG: D-sedoheptulose 7-phosphate isomerase [Lentisphaeria bacterium]|nr:D-sedoheptulose 7-phosphate isomerase [Lentisphaeria bacterium]